MFRYDISRDKRQNRQINVKFKTRYMLEDGQSYYGMCFVPCSTGVNTNQWKRGIVLFGNDFCKSFVSSLTWLTVIVSHGKWSIIENESKQKQFRKFKYFSKTPQCDYNSFGYVTSDRYLILFGGAIYPSAKTSSYCYITDLIFFFDFLKMTWHQSTKVA